MTGSTVKYRLHPKEIFRAIVKERLSLQSQCAKLLKKRWIKGDLLLKILFTTAYFSNSCSIQVKSFCSHLTIKQVKKELYLLKGASQSRHLQILLTRENQKSGERTHSVPYNFFFQSVLRLASRCRSYIQSWSHDRADNGQWPSGCVHLNTKFKIQRP